MRTIDSMMTCHARCCYIDCSALSVKSGRGGGGQYCTGAGIGDALVERSDRHLHPTGHTSSRRRLGHDRAGRLSVHRSSSFQRMHWHAGDLQRHGKRQQFLALRLPLECHAQSQCLGRTHHRLSPHRLNCREIPRPSVNRTLARRRWVCIPRHRTIGYLAPCRQDDRPAIKLD